MITELVRSDDGCKREALPPTYCKVVFLNVTEFSETQPGYFAKFTILNMDEFTGKRIEKRPLDTLLPWGYFVKEERGDYDVGETGKLAVTDAPYFTPEIRRLIEEYTMWKAEKAGKAMHVMPVWAIAEVQKLAEKEVGLR